MVIQHYLALCKLRVVGLMLLCALVGMILATQHTWHWQLVLCGLVGIGLACAAGAALNHVIDRHIDAGMARTMKRPLPQYQLSTHQALGFAVLLATLSFGILTTYVNTTAALWTLSALLGYGVIYTAFLKHLTPQNIVIGGLSGALPPLLGWTCIQPTLSATPWLLVLIIYVWTPPHFWALSIAKLDEYRDSQLPMLPVTHGVTYTKQCIIGYTWWLVASTLLAFAIGLFHWPYLIASQVINIRFLQWVYRLKKTESKTTAMQTFRYSIVYLMWLFLIMLADHLWALHA